jgi:hypothetical protein
MKPYYKYMLFYTSLQLIGVVGITKLSEWEKNRREKLNK